SREAPLPFNVQAFHDANEAYQRLVFWTGLWSGIIRRNAPGAARRAWRSSDGSIRGLPANIAPGAARRAVGGLSGWLVLHLEDIFATSKPDDVLYFHAEMRDIFRIAARWPFRMKPRVAKIPCPGECQGRIYVYPPEEFRDEMRIVCDKCGRSFGEDEFGHEVLLFEQSQRELKKARKALDRLMRND